jgi:hypothetical protein
MAQPFKLPISPAITKDEKSLIAENMMLLYYEVYKNSPLLQGIARDGDGNLLLGGKQATNVGDPQGPFDAANLKTFYAAKALSTAENLRWFEAGTIKYPVTAASTSNVDLTGALPLVVDGVPFASPSFRTVNQIQDYTLASVASFPTFGGSLWLGRVLLKDQTNASENGIYEISVTGSTYQLTKAADTLSKFTATPSCLVPVQYGATNAGTLWRIEAGTTWTSDFVSSGLEFSTANLNQVDATADVTGTPSTSAMSAAINAFLAKCRAKGVIKN